MVSRGHEGLGCHRHLFSMQLAAHRQRARKDGATARWPSFPVGRPRCMLCCASATAQQPSSAKAHCCHLGAYMSLLQAAVAFLISDAPDASCRARPQRLPQLPGRPVTDLPSSFAQKHQICCCGVFCFLFWGWVFFCFCFFPAALARAYVDGRPPPSYRHLFAWGNENRVEDDSVLPSRPRQLYPRYMT